MLIEARDARYVGGFAYGRINPIAPEEFPQRVQRAQEVFDGKLWREQLREWDETFKPGSIRVHRELQSVDPDALSNAELIEYLTRCREHHAEMNILLALLGAIVTDSGGLLSHSAIVASRYGIPGVVGDPRRDAAHPRRGDGAGRRRPRRGEVQGVKKVVPLAKVRDRSVFSSKAFGLGEAAPSGLPLPPRARRSSRRPLVRRRRGRRRRELRGAAPDPRVWPSRAPSRRPSPHGRSARSGRSRSPCRGIGVGRPPDLAHRRPELVTRRDVQQGRATVSVRGREPAHLGPGDPFGELALIDEGVRSPSITATADLVCYGLTFWDFRPLVQRNAGIGWKLVQALAKRLRAAETPE
jgi:hypothetical protein